MTTRSLLTVALSIVAVAAIGLGVRYELKKRFQQRHGKLVQEARQKRELGYQVALLSFRQTFAAGVSRKDVEESLRAQNIKFRQMCFVNSEPRFKNVLADLTKIGEEDFPWYCGDNNAYIALQFSGGERRGVTPQSDRSDTLSAISIFGWSESCP
jgi:hypothetical protein